MIFAAFLPPITRGMLQGRKLFTPLGINLVSEALVKLGLAILLVFFGFQVYGAMAATVLGSFCAFFLSLFSLRQVLNSKEVKMPLGQIYSYSWPVFIIILAVLAFFSLDVIIARMVFNENAAGYYAFASTLAKMIFLATQPISRAMFPLAAEKKQPEGHPLLVNALIIISLCIAAALAVFYFFPDFLVLIFTGRIIPESIDILFYAAIAIGLLSITNLVLLYKLSIGKTRNYLLFLIFPAIECILLYLFSDNLVEYSLAFIVSSAIFLWGTIILLDK
jgi:O-antigen/teichoic acid export membrane protein